MLGALHAPAQAAYHPQQASWWYASATVIGMSRVEKRRHYLHDVLAGAALGYGVARLAIAAQPRGLLIAPLIADDTPSASQACIAFTDLQQVGSPADVRVYPGLVKGNPGLLAQARWE